MGLKLQIQTSGKVLSNVFFKCVQHCRLMKHVKTIINSPHSLFMKRSRFFLGSGSLTNKIIAKFDDFKGNSHDL